MLATLSGAMVVLFGAFYALLFALSRLNGQPKLLILAYAAYGVLVLATGGLAVSLNLQGYWWILVVTLLLGYLVAPHGIWHLCVGTHPERGGEH